MRNTTLEKELKDGRTCISITVGDSMYPMLRNRKDRVVIAPVNRPLRRYELPLYRRPGGQYVLHRVLHVKGYGYVMCGDNRWNREYPVPQEWILGVVTGFYRGDRFFSVDDFRYKAYVHIWCDFFWIRSLILLGKRGLRKMKKQIAHRNVWNRKKEGKKAFMACKAGEKTVVVPVGEASRSFQGMMYLNETGMFLWELFEREKSEEVMLEKLLEAYEIDREMAQAGLQKFLEKARKEGVLED